MPSYYTRKQDQSSFARSYFNTFLNQNLGMICRPGKRSVSPLSLAKERGPALISSGNSFYSLRRLDFLWPGPGISIFCSLSKRQAWRVQFYWQKIGEE